MQICAGMEPVGGQASSDQQGGVILTGQRLLLILGVPVRFLLLYMKHLFYIHVYQRLLLLHPCFLGFLHSNDSLPLRLLSGQDFLRTQQPVRCFLFGQRQKKNNQTSMNQTDPEEAEQKRSASCFCRKRRWLYSAFFSS